MPKVILGKRLEEVITILDCRLLQELPPVTWTKDNCAENKGFESGIVGGGFEFVFIFFSFPASSADEG
jgi:hypothetical protein